MSILEVTTLLILVSCFRYRRYIKNLINRLCQRRSINLWQEEQPSPQRHEDNEPNDRVHWKEGEISKAYHLHRARKNLKNQRTIKTKS
jgi:hypothetical protein